MNKLIALLLVLSVSFAHAQEVPGMSGSASCVPSDTAPGACFVSWSWNESPRAASYVQTLDPETGNWRAIQEAASARSGQSLDPVEPGALYRVVTCNDARDVSTCIGTSVFWALLRPAEQEIPELLVSDRGAVWAMPKTLPYEIQLGSYNEVHQYDYFRNANWTQMPPMTRPERRWNAKGFQLIDNVTNAIYDRYEQSRLPRPQLQAVTSAETTTVAPQWIGEVAESQRASFRASYLYNGPSDEAIVFGPESPNYTITVFTDPGCEHCAQIVSDLPQITAMGIRVRFLAYPLQGPESREGKLLKSVWCTTPSERPEALKKAMLGEPVPEASCNGRSVVHQYATARKLGLFAAPTIMTDQGEIIGGYLTPAELLTKLQGKQASGR
jgi:protein-disulfide isomerase